MIFLYMLLSAYAIGFIVGTIVICIAFVSWLDDREAKSYSYDSQAQAWRIFDDIQ